MICCLKCLNFLAFLRMRLWPWNCRKEFRRQAAWAVRAVRVGDLANIFVESSPDLPVPCFFGTWESSQAAAKWLPIFISSNESRDENPLFPNITSWWLNQHLCKICERQIGWKSSPIFGGDWKNNLWCQTLMPPSVQSLFNGHLESTAKPYRRETFLLALLGHSSKNVLDYLRKECGKPWGQTRHWALFEWTNNCKWPLYKPKKGLRIRATSTDFLWIVSKKTPTSLFT